MDGTAKAIQRELQSLFKEQLDGIKIDTVDDNIYVIYATIEGPRETPYEKGLFKVKIVFGPSYPNSPPKCPFSSF